MKNTLKEDYRVLEYTFNPDFVDKENVNQIVIEPRGMDRHTAISKAIKVIEHFGKACFINEKKDFFTVNPKTKEIFVNLENVTEATQLIGILMVHLETKVNRRRINVRCFHDHY